MCGGLKITRVPFGRTSSAGLLFFLVPGGHELFRSLQHHLVPRRPIVSIFAARVHTALSTPNVSRLSTVEPSATLNNLEVVHLKMGFLDFFLARLSPPCPTISCSIFYFCPYVIDGHIKKKELYRTARADRQFSKFTCFYRKLTNRL